MGFRSLDAESQLKTGLAIVRQILKGLSKAPELSLSLFEIWNDAETNSHILIVWKGVWQLNPIKIPNERIKDCSRNHEYRNRMEGYLREALKIRLNQ